MKNSVKVLLSIGFMVVAFGLALTFCTPKTEKSTNPQDTVKIDTVQNPVDTTAQTAPVEDSAAVN